MSDKKKLLMTASTFPRWEGDTEPRFVLDLAKSLRPYFDVTVLAPSAPGAATRELLEGVHVIRYRYFPIKKWETLCYPGAIVPRIREKKIRILLVPFLVFSLFCKLWMLKNKFDVVHAHWLIPQGILQSFFKMPYLVTGHGADVSSLNFGMIKKLKTRCIRKASGVTAVSAHLKMLMLEFAPEKKVEIIPMGCDTKRFGQEHRIENYFEQNEKKVVLFVGRLAEKKGVTYLIDAMKHVDARLVIVGKGPLEDSLKRQAETLGDKVQFLGGKTHQELVNIYASADLFVAPSVTAADGDVEGFGLVIIEAMASGLPVIASDSGGIRDIVIDKKNGLLVPEKNSEALARAIDVLIQEKDLCKSFSAEAIQTAAQFDYDVIGKQYAKLLDASIIKA